MIFHDYFIAETNFRMVIALNCISFKLCLRKVVMSLSEVLLIKK